MIERKKILDAAFSDSFITKMKNRLLVSHYKYGDVKKNAQFIDFIKQLKMKLCAYEKTGNPEYLVDVCNYAMLESKVMAGDFRSTDDDEYSKYII